jgi:hypothetical protein
MSVRIAVALHILDCRMGRITLSDRTMAIGHFFCYRTIGKSNIVLAIKETIGLLDIMDIRSRPQSIGLSDMGLRKNYRLPTSDTRIQCVRGGGRGVWGSGPQTDKHLFR